MTTTGPSRLQLTVRHPNSVAFMYSPQPLIVASNGNAGALAVTAKLTHMESGRTHTETRAFYDGAVRFDLSRIMQLLQNDLRKLLGAEESLGSQRCGFILNEPVAENGWRIKPQPV